MIKEFLYSTARRRVITRMLEIFFLGGVTSLIYSQDFRLLVPAAMIAVLEAFLKGYREYLKTKNDEMQKAVDAV